ncbi:hypothetical protein [Agriterribacter sp.]|uniref:baeRF3 domain-containing protein n=1 Tax=Agriterribacter sp. TaxID=2821509 RepID=UPI002CD78E56|nr:hypothetical protein [Agriterribacter sp.]HTN06837.1 hypothetical protein [Agriterribacter sp.]
MNPVLQPQIQELIETAHYRPAVSIFLPFKPVMTSKTMLSHVIKASIDQVERQLLRDYPSEVAKLIMHKLHTLVSNINYNIYKKSIAIYVSPVFEKILYLDIEMEHKIVVDETFEIRDLLYNKKLMKNYLVLLLSGTNGKIYLGENNRLTLIVSPPLKPAYIYRNDLPERVSNFSDISERKKIIMEKFLRHTDASLRIIMDAYKLPLFVIGPERVLGHFKKITHHKAHVIEYLTGSYHEFSVNELEKLLEPLIHNWEKVKQTDLLHKINDAADKHKLVVGPAEIWKEAMCGKGKLLIVEKNYFVSAERQNELRIIPLPPHPYSKFSNIHDAIDDIIEKILLNSGDVEFVEDGMLPEYGGAVLIKHY